MVVASARQHLGEFATDLAVDLERRDDPAERLALHPIGHRRSESPRSTPTRALEVDSLELAAGRLGCLVGDCVERLGEGVARAQCVGHQLQDVGELLLERSATSVGPDRQVAPSDEQCQRERRPVPASVQRATRAGHRPRSRRQSVTTTNSAGTQRNVRDVERLGEAGASAAPVDRVVGERGDPLTERGAPAPLLSCSSVESELSAAELVVDRRSAREEERGEPETDSDGADHQRNRRTPASSRCRIAAPSGDGGARSPVGIRRRRWPSPCWCGLSVLVVVVGGPAAWAGRRRGPLTGPNACSR